MKDILFKFIHTYHDYEQVHLFVNNSSWVCRSITLELQILLNTSINYYKLFNVIDAYDNRLAPKIILSHGMVLGITSHTPLRFLQLR